MKRIIFLALALVMCLGTLTACFVYAPESEVDVMTYDEFVAAEEDSEVVVETYVQDKQGWWFSTEKNSGLATLYTQAPDGAYFIYDMPCTEEEYNALTVGTKIRVKGHKTVWQGEVEIIDATYEILEGSFIADVYDVTALLGDEALVDHQNKKVGFTKMKVEASNDEGAAFLYKWNGAGSEGDDIYFNASVDGKTYTFVIESYLRGKDTEVYKAAQALKVGDVIDMEGFLYWYDGAQPHVTSITKAEGIMSHADYDAADMETEVKVITYIQDKQGWWFNTEENSGLATLYTQAPDGAYFVHEMPCTEEEYNALTIGTRVLLSGYKSEWSGEVEIIDATYEILPGKYVAEAYDATALLGTDELISHQNERVSFSNMTVVASNDAGDAFLYKWNGAGSEGDDIYFNASVNGKTYTFVIESYFTPDGSAAYEAAQALKVGDVINMEAFLYWYNGVQPHVYSITVVEAE